MNKPMLFCYTLCENDAHPYNYMLVYCENEADGKVKLKRAIGNREDSGGVKHGLRDCWKCTVGFK
jgi:hypothetical protein